MWLSATTFEICFSTTMFYSIFFISKCRSDGIIPGGMVWKNNKDSSFQIYTNKIPWKHAKLSDQEKRHFVLKAWLLSTISIGIIACFCCVCWKFYRKSLSRGQTAHICVVPPRVAEIVPPDSRTVLAFQINHSISTGLRNLSTGTGNIYSRGVVNFAFSTNVRDPVTAPTLELDDRSFIPHLELDDRPPEYSVVVSQNFNEGLATALHPQVSQSKTVETPPPDYSTISPFDSSCRSANNAGESFV